MKADEPLLELETDKVTLEVNAPAAGMLSEIIAKDGDTVAPGALLGQIGEGAGAAAAPPRAPAAAAPAPRRPAPARRACAGAGAPPSPAAAKNAADRGIDVGDSRRLGQARPGAQGRRAGALAGHTRRPRAASLRAGRRPRRLRRPTTLRAKNA